MLGVLSCGFYRRGFGIWNCLSVSLFYSKFVKILYKAVVSISLHIYSLVYFAYMNSMNFHLFKFLRIFSLVLEKSLKLLNFIHCIDSILHAISNNTITNGHRTM